MPAQTKAFSDLQWRQRNRVVGTVFEMFEAHCPSVADATMRVALLPLLRPLALLHPHNADAANIFIIFDGENKRWRKQNLW
jgi:hypothetical protein